MRTERSGRLGGQESRRCERLRFLAKQLHENLLVAGVDANGNRTTQPVIAQLVFRLTSHHVQASGCPNGAGGGQSQRTRGRNTEPNTRKCSGTLSHGNGVEILNATPGLL
jgi:hypothetical protein